MPKELGRKIASHRQRRGLSQTEFGRLIGRSEAWVSQVERGVRPVKSLEVLELIAQAVDAPLAELAPTAPKAAVEALPAEAEPLRHLLSANYALRAALDSNHRCADVTDLQRYANRAWELTHASEYSELIPLLETLLPQMERASRGARANEVFPLLAKTYHACAAALAKLRQFDAAWVAADRAIAYAGRAGEPLLMAEGAFRLTLIFQGARHLDQAKHTAATASAALADLVDEGRPEALSIYGALQLQLAVVAARTERSEDAEYHLKRARDVADRIGAGRNDYNTEFGPTNVALHEVAVAVDLGNAGAAIRRAETIDASALSAERQSRLLIDVARAWTQRRNVSQAVSALEAAEQVAPEQVRGHRLVHATVRDLLRITSEPPAALDALARRIDVAP